MEKVKINLAGKDYETIVNFRLSFRLTKFRNKLNFGVDFSDADKDTIKEVILMRSQIAKEGGLDNIDVSKLSEKTSRYLLEKSSQTKEVFEFEELIEMGKALTGIEDEAELEKIYDEEVQLTGYDELVGKLTTAVSMVFMNANDGLTEQEIEQEMKK